MAKLFVSCPMRGRTERQIRDTINQLCDIAEAIFNEKFEVIDNVDRRERTCVQS